MPRLVYSLRFETERQPGDPITEFIVPLDRKGNSTVIRPVGKPRVVDLRPAHGLLCQAGLGRDRGWYGPPVGEREEMANYGVLACCILIGAPASSRQVAHRLPFYWPTYAARCRA
jgi:hypothetical protein